MRWGGFFARAGGGGWAGVGQKLLRTQDFSRGPAKKILQNFCKIFAKNFFRKNFFLKSENPPRVWDQAKSLIWPGDFSQEKSQIVTIKPKSRGP